jgi:hypothetical protein
MGFSGDYGAVTGAQSVVLVLVFSEPVTGLALAQLSIAGPAGASLSALKLLHGTLSYYHVLLDVPASYSGPVSISFTVRKRCHTSDPAC